MGNAILLFFFALPAVYFQPILRPFEWGLVALVPASGYVTLGVSIVLAASRREKGIFWILIPIALSHALMAAGFLFAGQFHEPGGILSAFLGLQLGLLAFVIYKCPTARTVGILAGWFTFTYALTAYAIAGMSLADSWL